MTTTMRQWLDEFSTTYGQAEHLTVSGGSSWGDYGLEHWPTIQRNAATPMADVPAEFLDHSFDDGYGAPGCPAVCAWSATHVFAVYCYDGATGWFSLPRSPMDFDPPMPGGG